MERRTEKKRNFVVVITAEEYELLRTEPVRRAISEARDRDPLQVALDRHIPHARLVATQVKYLARAAAKLPSYAAAECILPPRAFEQASSEACAAHKRIEGDAVLDLTCGLGVDALALSRRFGRVVALERNEVLAAVARENFARLGARNIEVVAASAEEYLERCSERFDWIYADPDRRGADGRKLVRLEECSPDILALLPRIRKAGGGLCLKNSPLFDVDEALRLFPTAGIEVVSLGGECKEVMIYDDGRGPSVTATALGRGSFTAVPGGEPVPMPGAFDAARYGWVVLPDVALQKARLVRRRFAGAADVWSENGAAFFVGEPCGEYAASGRVFAVERIEPYDPRRLKSELKGLGVEIFLRDFPVSQPELMRRLGVHPGCGVRLLLTRIGRECWAVRLR